MATRTGSRKPRATAAPIAASSFAGVQPETAAIPHVDTAPPAHPSFRPAQQRESPRGGDARPGETRSPLPDIKQLLTFFASGHEYAVSVLHVREIAEYRTLAPVPGTPRWIRGVMNLRGTVVPVIDLAAKLGMPPTAITRRTCLLIVDLAVNGEPMVLAIMVDAVNRVVDLSPADLQEVPSFGPRVDTAFLVGMARLDNRLILLLDINGVIESEDMVAAAAAISALDEQLPEIRSDGGPLAAR